MAVNVLARGLVPKRSPLYNPSLASIASSSSSSFSSSSSSSASSSSIRRSRAVTLLSSHTCRHFSSSPARSFNHTLQAHGIFGWGASQPPPPLHSLTGTSNSSPQASTPPHQQSPSLSETSDAQKSSVGQTTAPQTTQSAGSDPSTTQSDNPPLSESSPVGADPGSWSATPDPAVSVGDAIADVGSAAPSQAGESLTTITRAFSEIDHSWWPNVNATEHILNLVHSSTGMPWWATVFVSVMTVRLALLPVAVKAQARGIRSFNHRHKVQEFTATIKAARSSGDQMRAQKAMHEMQQYWEKHDISPARTMIAPLAQGAIFTSFFFALRRLAENGLEGLQQPFLWIPSLAEADPYYVTPVLAAGLTLLSVETGAELGAQSGNKMDPKMKTIFRFLAPLALLFTFKLPAIVFVSWVTNNIYTLTQMLAFHNPRVQKALNLPKRVQEDKAYKADKTKLSFSGFWKDVKMGYQSAREAQEKAMPVDRRKSYEAWLKSGKKDVESRPIDALSRLQSAPPAQTSTQPTGSQSASHSSASSSSPRSDLFEGDKSEQQQPAKQTTPSQSSKPKLRPLSNQLPGRDKKKAGKKRR